MARKRYKPEEIVGLLRQAEVLHGQGLSMADAIRQLGISEVTFYPGFPSCSPFDDRAADEAIIKRRFARAACRMVRTGDGKRASGRAGSRGA